MKVDLAQGLTRLFQGVGKTSPLNGWGWAQWGQNKDEVRRYFLDAQEVEGDLVLANQDPAPRHYSITLSFDDQKRLSKVALIFAGSEEVDDFAHIAKRITENLGAPVSQTSLTTTWVKDSTRFTLSKAPQGGVVLDENA